MSRSSASNRRDNVVLPAPEGEDKTNSNPRRLIFEVPVALFNVLYLLAHLVDYGFECQAQSGDVCIV